MKRNWICSSMVVAMFALLAGGCGNSQRTLEFRGICVDDAQGEHGSVSYTHLTLPTICSV